MHAMNIRSIYTPCGNKRAKRSAVVATTRSQSQRDRRYVHYIQHCVPRPSYSTQSKQVRTGRFSREKEDAYDYFNQKIQEIDALADTEYADIVSSRQKLVGVSILDPSKSEDASTSRFSRHDIYQLLVPSRVRMLFGEGADFFYGTGVVTFKTIAAKQSGEY